MTHGLYPQAMARGDWAELERLVLKTGEIVSRGRKAASGISEVIGAFNAANAALPASPDAAAQGAFVAAYAAWVAPLDGAARTLEEEMAALAPRQQRILDLLYADREAVSVAEDYLMSVATLGSAATYVLTELATFPKTLRRLGAAVPAIQPTTESLAASMQRVLIALEPADEWGDRSLAILAGDWS